MAQERTPEPNEIDAHADLSGGSSPKIQPMLAGLALAAVIAAIVLAAFWMH